MEKAVPASDDHRHDSSHSPVAGDKASGGKCALDIVQLVTEYHAIVYRYAFRLTGSAVDAEDLAQQAFLLAHQRLAQLREPEKAVGWLLTIVRNCFLKSRRKEHVCFEPFDEDQAVSETVALPEWIDLERLQQALARLPDDARLILVLFFFEDCSYKEIAEALQVPMGTVMSRLSRAKHKLREELSDLAAETAGIPTERKR